MGKAYSCGNSSGFSKGRGMKLAVLLANYIELHTPRSYFLLQITGFPFNFTDAGHR